MTKLEHVGVAFDDVEAALTIIRELLREESYKSETIERDAVRTHFIRGGGAKLELLQALDDSSSLARFLRKRTGGLHHLAFEVDDLDATHRRLAQTGFRLLDDAPRAGADGQSIFFVDPRDTGGVLFEFCRRTRSILRSFVAETPSGTYRIRLCGRPGNPVLLVLDHDFEDLDAFAALLEPSIFFLALDGTGAGRTERQDVAADFLKDIAAVLDQLRGNPEWPDASAGRPSLRHESVPDPQNIVQHRGKNRHSVRIHLAATSTTLALIGETARIALSTTLFVVDEAEPPSYLSNVLYAARPVLASAAVGLWSRRDGDRIVIADEDLIATSVERHVRRAEAAAEGESGDLGAPNGGVT